MVCGNSLTKARSNPGAATVYPIAANLQSGIHRTKMAVFDIDDTLFDTSQRETNAKRAGLAPATPYTGDRKPSEYPKGKKAFMDFFNSPKQFRIDPIFPGALDHVRTLVRDGYTIAYLTGRPNTYFNATMEHLKEKGFPVFNDGNGQPLLFMKPNKKRKTAQFKYDVVRNLQGKFDVHYFYDDLKENRDMAFKLGVIGVYDLRDRLGVRGNPGHPRSTEKQMIGLALSALNTVQYSTKRDRPESPTISTYQEAINYWQNKYDSIRDNPAPNCGCGQTPCKTYGTRSNPPRYREAAGCIVQRGSDKKILLLRRSIHETSFHGMFELPGGKLEEGETPKEAALNETKEEAGLDVRITKVLPPHIDHDMKKVYHGFVGAPKKGAKVKISEEHDEYKWVSIKQALALPSGKLSHHARFLLGAMQAEESIKGTKIVKQPGPDGKKCGTCTHYCSRTNTCHLWSKKKGSKVFVLPDWFCQGYAAMSRPNSNHQKFNCYECGKPISKEDHYLYFGSCAECLNKNWNRGPVYDYDDPDNLPLSNPLPKPRKKNGRKEPSKKFVDRMMGNTKMRAEFPDAGQRYAVTLRLVEKHYGKAARKKIAPKDNPSHPSEILPIYSGEPKGMTKNLGAIFSEVVIGRNIVKDVGEVVQSIYRGLIGGRTSMAERRLAMGVASMQKELSDNAKALGGNAIANLKMDYEVIQGTATISIVANADAIKMRSPPKKNPAPSKKVKRAKDKYKKFHGGKEPVSVKTEKIDVGDVWYALGPCWSIGYMSPKETGDDEQKYIHHTNEDSKDGNFPMMYATMPENGEPMIVIKGGSMKIGMRDGLAWLID